MTPETLFSSVNLVALLTWITLIVRPRHPGVLRLAGLIVPSLFAVTYSILVLVRMGRGEGDFNSLAGVSALFRDPWILTAGWIHYLVFDLLVGVWEAREAAKRNMPWWTLAPCLVLTFLFGPMGWLVFMVVRSRHQPVPPATNS